MFSLFVLRLQHEIGITHYAVQVHEWVDDYGGRIWHQQKRMGISVDWDRQVFTLDAARSRAVLEAFVRFHEVRCRGHHCFRSG